MNTATRKAKGKRLQKYVCNLILKFFPILSEKDVFPSEWEGLAKMYSSQIKLKKYFHIQLNAKIRKE